MDFRNMRTSMESVTGLFETLRSLHKELEIITMDHNTNPTTVIFIFIMIAQETLDTLRSLHRELELEDGAEEPEEQVLSSNIFLRSDRSFQLSGLLSNDFQVPWQEVLRGPDAIDLWLDRIVRWFNTFLSNTNILTWNLNWSTCWALFGNENLFLLLLGTWQYCLLHQFTKYCSLTGLWCKNQRLEAVKLFT